MNLKTFLKYLCKKKVSQLAILQSVIFTPWSLSVMFLTSALGIMLQLYKEHCSVLKKNRDHELCPAWCFVWLGWLVLFMFLVLFMPKHSSLPSSTRTNESGCTWVPRVGGKRPVLEIVLSEQALWILKPQNNCTVYSKYSVAQGFRWDRRMEEQRLEQKRNSAFPPSLSVGANFSNFLSHL